MRGNMRCCCALVTYTYAHICVHIWLTMLCLVYVPHVAAACAMETCLKMHRNGEKCYFLGAVAIPNDEVSPHKRQAAKQSLFKCLRFMFFVYFCVVVFG